MDFHAEFTPAPFATRIRHGQKLLLAGSCFTENMAEKLRHHKFEVLENPHGILFNPVSIGKAVTSYIENKRYTAEELFFENELWGSWQHHTRFSDVTQQGCLDKINRSQEAANAFLKTADWIVLTLGSAFVYEKDKEVVANCHKVPTDKFRRRLLAVEEVLAVLDNLIHRLLMFNPRLNIVFTISPVRHLREGFIENNRSKAVLIQTVHHLVDKFNKLFYFPAYELVMDDLRDYRFYAEDMVHPNYQATQYVWEKFVRACIDEPTQTLMKQIADIRTARLHKPFNPTSAAHQKFLQTYLDKTTALQQQLPELDFGEELGYFGGGENMKMA
jgi:hypothetical protein